MDHAIGGDGKGIAIMDFDAASNRFSNYRVVYQSTTQYPGWPFFLADGSAVVFALGQLGAEHEHERLSADDPRQ